VIAVAFLPVFTLVDQEGRLFKPLATSCFVSGLPSEVTGSVTNCLREQERDRTGDVQLGKLSAPLRRKRFSAAVAETG